MPISKSTFFVFAAVVFVMTLSVTVFKSQGGTTKPAQKISRAVKSLSHEESIRRYPTADFDEALSPDPSKRAALKQRQLRNNDIAFGEPSAEDEATALIPERLFDFPALPVTESDAIVLGYVASAKAHRSENKQGIFSEFEVRVDEVLKGEDLVTKSNMIVVERTGGFLKYPNGRKVLFFIMGYGMPQVGTRNVFFLKSINSGLRIVTVYELTPDGVLPIDQSKQFSRFQGEKEEAFLATLRDIL